MAKAQEEKVMDRIHRILAAFLLAGLAVCGAVVQAAPPAGSARASDFDIQVDPAKVAAHNLTQDEVGQQIQRALDRLPRNLSDDAFMESVRKIQIIGRGGKKIPLVELARIVPKEPKPPASPKAPPPVTRRVSIQPDVEKLKALGLTVEEVSKQIQAQVKAQGKGLSVEALDKVVIATPDGKQVKLSQVATYEMVPVKGKDQPKADGGEGPKPVLMDESSPPAEDEKPKGRLDFRIVPEFAGSDKPLAVTEAEEQAMVDRLAKGDYKPQRGDKYVWAELACDQEGFIVADCRGKKLVLLCNLPDRVMLAGQTGERAWGLQTAYRTLDAADRPCVGMRLDKAGAELFAALTGDHVGRRLAILLDGKLVHAPRIMQPVSEATVISGRFTDKEIREIVAALKAGMKTRPPAKETKSIDKTEK